MTEPSDTQPLMPGRFSDRGFFYYEPIHDSYNNKVQVYDSSAVRVNAAHGGVDGPFLWLKAIHTDGAASGYAHLAVDEVHLLRNQLSDWLRRVEAGL